jgi:integrase
MKTGQDVSTSLPEQALVVLRERNMGVRVPPSDAPKISSPQSRCLEQGVTRYGFQGEHTTHGFRASLRTLGRERLGIDVDVPESQLAHTPKDEVQAAYAHVKFREKRREVMQAWANYLDTLKVANGKPESSKEEQQ